MPKSKFKTYESPRHAAGWPCIYCGKPLRRCHGSNKTRKSRRCCGECKGKASH